MIRCNYKIFIFLFSLSFLLSCQEEEGIFVQFENYGTSPNNHLFFNSNNPIFSEYMTFNSWKNSQGGVIYGDMLLNVLACDEEEDDADNAFMWDLKTGTKIGSFNLGHEFEGVKYYKPHANVVCFGAEKTEKSDYPLLYVGQTYGFLYDEKDYKASGIMVYELLNESGVYSSNIVQIIRPDVSDGILMQAMGKSIHNYVVDADNRMLYSLGYESDQAWFDSNKDILFTSFRLPKLSDGKEVILTNENIVDKFTIPMAYCMQCIFYDKGILYIQTGTNMHYKWLRSFNLNTKKIESKVDFTEIGGEPQFCGYWNGKFLIYFAGDWTPLFEIQKD